jgi:hypothetical protein
VITESDLAPSPHIGLRTFDEINATYAEVTMVDPTTPAVDMTFQELRQSLPAVENLNTFLSSHQVAIAQLAIQYCDAMIGTAGSPGLNLGTLFPGFDWNDGSAYRSHHGNEYRQPADPRRGLRRTRVLPGPDLRS